MARILPTNSPAFNYLHDAISIDFYRESNYFFYFIMNVTGRNRFLKFLLKFEILLKALKIQEKLIVLKVENASFGEKIKKAW
ncbi:hypothetical protein C6W19_11845 [Bacillus sp. RJGP41]|nr:hypothetical protein C6W19_11845 [Bacillus sp. RJGP41]